MARLRLTEKEKITLYGLVKHPELNDRELADKIDLKLSTVTAIRRRLYKDGVFQTRRIPQVQHLGCELMILGYGSFNQAIPAEVRTRVFKERVESIPNVFFAWNGQANGLFASMSYNYTQAKIDMDELKSAFNKELLLDTQKWKHLILPFQVTYIPNFFDYTSVLRHLFDIDDPGLVPKDLVISIDKPKDIVLSKKERTVFKYLVEFPDHPDNRVADDAGVSRQAVSNMRKRFESSGILITRRIVDLDKIGAEIFAVVYSSMNPNASLESRIEGVRYSMERIPIFFFALGNFESILFGVGKDFQDFEDIKNDVVSFYKSKGFMAGEPEVQLFSVKESKPAVFHRYNKVTESLLKD